MKVIVLNTLYYAVSWCNNTIDRVADPADQFAWLEKELASTPKTQQIIISAHVPPGYRTEYPTLPLWQPQYIPRFEKIISKYADLISGMFFGHVHRDDYKLLYLNGLFGFGFFFVLVFLLLREGRFSPLSK